MQNELIEVGEEGDAFNWLVEAKVGTWVGLDNGKEVGAFVGWIGAEVGNSTGVTPVV